MAGAPQQNDPNFTHDMTPHNESWAAFNSLAKWTSILTIIVLVGMFIFLVPHGKPV